MSRCYLCGNELTDTNRSKEHIIPNGIGGRLKSSELLCIKCNNEMGDGADASLSEDLKFFVEMFQIQRERNKELKGIVMEDSDGHKILVKEGGYNLKLHEENASVNIDDNGTKTFSGLFRDKKSMDKVLDKYVRKGKLTQVEADKISCNSTLNNERKMLSTKITISEKAFPSIVKTLVSFYIDKTGELSISQLIKPYILGEKECKSLMTLMILPQNRLAPDYKSVYHTLKIHGKNGEGLVGVAEFFSVYSYAVMLDENYSGEDLDLCYCYDLIEQTEIADHNPSITLSADIIKNIHSSFHSNPQPFWDELTKRMDMVYGLKQDLDQNNELQKIITETLSSIPEGSVITEQIINKLTDNIVNKLIKPRLK